MPLLRLIDAERAHALALRVLRHAPMRRNPRPDDPALANTVLGLRFSSPIGLAAGFDKDGLALTALIGMGFGFVEAGTVTPLAQPGNPKPRLFRLREDAAVINRMGFNNRGIDEFCHALSGVRRRRAPVGANLGINKQQAEPERDYPALVAKVAPLVDYVVLNLSSPNTPGLRDLQGAARLSGILGAISRQVPQRPKLLIKLAPDLDDEALPSIVQAAIAGGADGLIVSNTTIARPTGLRSPLARELGGLSGAPLFERSTAMLRQVHRLSQGRLTLIGVGGVSTGLEALAKIRAGASLVQLYTAFAYEGPGIIPRIKRELLAAMRQAGFGRIAEAVGVDA